MIRAVLFDLDATLLDREASLADFLPRQYERFLPQLQHIPRNRYIARFLELDDNGSVWKDRVYQQLVAEFGISGIRWDELLNDYVERFQDSCIGFPHLHTTLDTLTAQGYQLGIVTNGRTPFQEQNIRSLGIYDYFAVILVSAAERIRKPDPAIFHRAVERLGVTTQETVFIGDHPQADVMGAQQCGMRAIWRYNRYWQECTFADAICHSLEEIPSLLRDLP